MNARFDVAPRRFLALATLLAVLMVAWMLGACSGAYAWSAPTRADVPSNATPQRVVRREQYLDVRDVPVGWQRPDDPIAGAMYFLFSDQGYGCAVTAADFTMARDGDEFLCVWRRFR